MISLEIYRCITGNYDTIGVHKNNSLKQITKAAICSYSAEALFIITTLALGIVGALGLIPGMPLAASYTLISVGGLIALLWGLGACLSGGDIPCGAVQDLLKAVNSEPKSKKLENNT